MDTFNLLHLLLCMAIALLPRTHSTEVGMESYYGASEYGGFGPYDGYMSDWGGQDPSAGREWGISGRMNQPRCVDIPSNMTLCRGIGYTSMRLPNLLEHDTMREVLQQASQWVPLLGRQCHPDTNVFLCSLFSPVCLERLIYPCRSLCESVKAGCEQHMVKYGYPWPDMLSCSKFPPDNGLCIGMRTDREEGMQTCSACNQPNTFEAIVDNYCSSESVYRTKLRSERQDGGDKVVRSGKKIRKMKGTDPTRTQKQSGLQMRLADSSGCECGLAHDRSPDYYAMGNYSADGSTFYAHAFHLYDKRSAEQKRALRAIRKDRRICERVGVDMLATPRDRPQQEPEEGKKGRRRQERGRRDRQQGGDDGGATPADRQEVGNRKQRPDDEEIARRKAERAERRRQERLAQKMAEKQGKKNDDDDGEESPQPDIAEQEEVENINNERSSKRQRNEERRSRERDGSGSNNKEKSRERGSRDRSGERRSGRRGQSVEEN